MICVYIKPANTPNTTPSFMCEAYLAQRLSISTDRIECRESAAGIGPVVLKVDRVTELCCLLKYHHGPMVTGWTKWKFGKWPQKDTQLFPPSCEDIFEVTLLCRVLHKLYYIATLIKCLVGAAKLKYSAVPASAAVYRNLRRFLE